MSALLLAFLAVVGFCSSTPESVKHFTVEQSKTFDSSQETNHDLWLLNEENEGKYRLSYADYMDTWLAYKTQYNKYYDSLAEEKHRFGVFMENVKYIEWHNWRFHNNETTFWLGINDFTDMTDQEFRQYNGFSLNSTFPLAGGICSLYRPTPNYPASRDWRLEGYVTNVKNQGSCGSCWAFSTTGSVEGMWFAKTRQLVSLSEQQLIDCSSNYGNNGCNGGLPEKAFAYIRDARGLQSEVSYPYKQSQGTCRFQKSKVRAQISSCKFVSPTNEKALQAAVGNTGPVSVAIDASSKSFKSYRGGLYNNPTCSSRGQDLDHAVLAVGYGTTGKGKDYWIVKNSWGTEWGDNGYIYMSRNQHNQCGIATYASFPVL